MMLTDEIANQIIAVMLYLDSEDPGKEYLPIYPILPVVWSSGMAVMIPCSTSNRTVTILCPLLSLNGVIPRRRQLEQKGKAVLPARPMIHQLLAARVVEY